MRLFALLLVLAVPARAQPADSTVAREVVAVAERFFDALAAADTMALAALLHPAAQVVSVSPGGRAEAESGASWAQSIGAWRGPPLRERMYAPRIDVDGPLAALWARYDFHIGDAFSHCGTDAFQFVRDGPAWRLLTVTFTIQTEGCPPAP